ncbi:MAG TPA: TraR/DksA C4-type zinc finger protein [Flavisolibacter sp.]|nr:TraR/DksA C4-type zinc finger protein [Flavisolibacter sp.]
MATKKQVPKKAAKAVKPAKKAAAKKPAAVKKAVKPAAKKTVVAKKPAPKHAVKKAAPAPKKPAKITKSAPKPIHKKVEPAKKPVPVKPMPEKQPEPVKKISVGGPSHQEVKPVIKPLEKPMAKKEPPKPVKIVIPKTSTTKVVKYDPDFTRSVLDTPQHVQSGPSMRYSDTELTEFRELIMKKLETAKKELAYLQGLITRKDEGGDMEDGRYMTMEDGSMSMEREQLSQMASRQIQFIDHLEKALMRIENKTYGICRVTGKLIDKARLRAVPHATLSIEAKQMMNK